MTVRLIETGIPGLIVIEPAVHADQRGFFMECWRSMAYAQAGLPDRFVQCNLSQSGQGVVRGLHYQYPEPQGKLVCALQGRVFDVGVDIRRGSATFGMWAGVELSAENHRQLYVPEGFAHGFCVLGESALLGYLCTAEYRAEYDAALAWDDPDIGIDWPVGSPRLSDKDGRAPRLADIPPDRLPQADS